MGLLRRGRPRDEGGDHGGHDGGAAGPRVRVLSREGCHLCEQALEVVAAVCTELGEAWEVVDVDADPALRAQWSDEVPVTFVDERQHDFWRVDPARLRAALTAR